ncbi:ABC transporter substrate-binding protein [Tepidiforma sp.]|uniref:ABC transporter substrate-binding protein n=1 Tax=Tepidiforma sp. TaxID=2682230 RepID=UPI002ADDA85F|nr:ABC transporter substrate-binding protein [Tepidiforma sp.]
MSENYWKRKLARQGITRRRVLGGAAVAGLGTAALGLVGCGDDDDDSGPASGSTPSGSASPAASPTQASQAPQKGGTARFVSANNTWDTFDVDRSRFSPVAWLMGMTNLGVTQWKSFSKAELEGGIAEKWEQPDKQTLVFTIRPNVYWHNKPPVNGRQATAEDVAFFINRNKNAKLLDGTEDPNFYRKSAYQNVDRVEVVDPRTVRVTFSKPDPFFLTTLAGSYSKVQAPEAVQAFEKDYANMKADLVIGTGAFVLTKWSAEGNSEWVRHEKFHTQVNWDGVKWLPLFTDQSAQQVAFEQKQIDAFIPTQNQVIQDLLKRYEGKIHEVKIFSGNPQAGTYYGGAAPWNNPNLIGAIFRALDRRALIQSLLQGKGVLSGNVPPTQAAFSITERELITFPGYLEDRALEEAEAKKMWEAGGGPALGEIIVDIPDIWEGLYSGGAALITNQLSRVLGNKFTAKIEPYATITGKIVKQEYGNGKNNIWYGWITEVSDPEPTLLNFLQYNSTQPQFQQFGVKIDKVDQLTAQAVEEFDIAKRQELSKEVMRELIKNYGAGIPYNMVAVNSSLRWNYLKYPEAVAFVQQHQYGTQWWFDQTDPTWQGRPA